MFRNSFLYLRIVGLFFYIFFSSSAVSLSQEKRPDVDSSATDHFIEFLRSTIKQKEIFIEQLSQENESLHKEIIELTNQKRSLEKKRGLPADIASYNKDMQIEELALQKESLLNQLSFMRESNEKLLEQVKELKDQLQEGKLTFDLKIKELRDPYENQISLLEEQLTVLQKTHYQNNVLIEKYAEERQAMAKNLARLEQEKKTLNDVIVETNKKLKWAEKEFARLAIDQRLAIQKESSGFLARIQVLEEERKKNMNEAIALTLQRDDLEKNLREQKKSEQKAQKDLLDYKQKLSDIESSIQDRIAKNRFPLEEKIKILQGELQQKEKLIKELSEKNKKNFEAASITLEQKLRIAETTLEEKEKHLKRLVQQEIKNTDELAQLKKMNEALQVQLQNIETVLQKSEKAFQSQFEEEKTVFEEQKKTLETKMLGLQKSFQEAQLNQSNIENQNVLLKQRAEDLAKTLKETQDNWNNLKDVHQKTKEDFELTKKDLAAFRERALVLEQEIDQVRAQEEKEKIKTVELENLRRQQAVLTEKLSLSEEENSRIKSKLTAAENNLQNAQKEIETQKINAQVLKAFTEERENLKKQIVLSAAEIKDLNKKITNYEREIFLAQKKETDYAAISQELVAVKKSLKEKEQEATLNQKEIKKLNENISLIQKDLASAQDAKKNYPIVSQELASLKTLYAKTVQDSFKQKNEQKTLNEKILLLEKDLEDCQKTINSQKISLKETALLKNQIEQMAEKNFLAQDEIKKISFELEKAKNSLKEKGGDPQEKEFLPPKETLRLKEKVASLEKELALTKKSSALTISNEEKLTEFKKQRAELITQLDFLKQKVVSLEKELAVFKKEKSSSSTAKKESLGRPSQEHEAALEELRLAKKEILVLKDETTALQKELKIAQEKALARQSANELLLQNEIKSLEKRLKEAQNQITQSQEAVEAKHKEIRIATEERERYYKVMKEEQDKAKGVQDTIALLKLELENAKELIKAQTAEETKVLEKKLEDSQKNLNAKNEEIKLLSNNLAMKDAQLKTFSQEKEKWAKELKNAKDQTEKLTAQILKLTKDLEESRLNTEKEISKIKKPLEKELLEVKTKLKDAEKNMSEFLEKDKKDALIKISALEKDVEKLNKLIAVKESETAGAKKLKEEMERNLAAEKEKNNLLQQERAELSTSLSQAREEKNTQLKELDQDYKKQLLALQQRMVESENSIISTARKETQELRSDHLAAVERLNKKLDSTQTELSQKIIQIGALSKEKEELLSKIEALNKNKEVVSAEISFIKKKLKETEALLTAKMEQEEPLRGKLQELQESLKNTQDLIAFESSEDILKASLAEKIKEARLPLQEKIFALEKKLDLLKEDFAKKEDEIKSVKTEKSILEKKVLDLEKEIKKLQQELGRANQKSSKK
ncbi:MAG TPA: hypothetical protein PKH98_00630 [Candidatus Omnitrophota bacterium]|nr:hypothetical protein [Candidatus Omnitrophota bacterium]